jgi:uncharacterized membrane protein YvlD (DUF360 family)
MVPGPFDRFVVAGLPGLPIVVDSGLPIVPLFGLPPMVVVFGLFPIPVEGLVFVTGARFVGAGRLAGAC